MRKVCCMLAAFMLVTLVLPAQDYSKDVKDLDSIIEALYGSISGEKDEARDWNRFTNLFIPEAQLIPSSKNAEGVTGYRILAPQVYVDNFGKRLEKDGFYEKEIHRVTEQYGSLCHMFSTYESYRSAADTEPFVRGINSIQLMHDGERWWIVSIYWLGEKEDNPLPEKYLPNEG